MVAQRRNGFTLVELLVVISIIALLIAILLPALGRARARVVVVQCSSNMRQIGIGDHIYMTEFAEHLPIWKLDDTKRANVATQDDNHLRQSYWNDTWPISIRFCPDLAPQSETPSTPYTWGPWISNSESLGNFGYSRGALSDYFATGWMGNRAVDAHSDPAAGSNRSSYEYVRTLEPGMSMSITGNPNDTGGVYWDPAQTLPLAADLTYYRNSNGGSIASHRSGAPAKFFATAGIGVAAALNEWNVETSNSLWYDGHVQGDKPPDGTTINTNALRVSAGAPFGYTEPTFGFLGTELMLIRPSTIRY